MPDKSFSLRFTKKIKRFSKTIRPDPDKSISIRSFILGCICEDVSQAKNVLIERCSFNNRMFKKTKL